MRNIKFRAWDKENKIMRYNAEKAYNGCYQLNDIQYFGQLINNPKYELQQYTGINDINGREIYEGDIIKLYDRYCEVYYNDFNATFDLKFIRYVNLENRDIMFSGIDNYKWKYYEVIGNIYENSDFIKEM